MNADLHGVAVSSPMPVPGEEKEENEADRGKANRPCYSCSDKRGSES